MGGLAVSPNEPSPYYEFEMLDIRNKEKGGKPVLFLHFVVCALPLFFSSFVWGDQPYLQGWSSNNACTLIPPPQP